MWGGTGAAGGVDGRQGGEAFGAIAVLCEAAEHGVVEEGQERETLPDGSVETGDDDGGKQGIASPSEEMVIFTDARDSEDAFPHDRDDGDDCDAAEDCGPDSQDEGTPCLNWSETNRGSALES